MRAYDDAMDIDDGPAYGPPTQPKRIPKRKRRASDKVQGSPPKKAKKQEPMAYHWTVTAYPPSEKFTEEEWKKWFFNVTQGEECPWPLHYMVAQVERGHKEKTTHIQGYCEFEKRMRVSSLKKLPSHFATAGEDDEGNTFHWEKRKGTPVQARDYCMKPTGKVSSTFCYNSIDPALLNESDDEFELDLYPDDDEEPEVSFAPSLDDSSDGVRPIQRPFEPHSDYRDHSEAEDEGTPPTQVVVD